MPKIPGIWPKIPKSHTTLAGENDQNYHPGYRWYGISVSKNIYVRYNILVGPTAARLLAGISHLSKIHPQIFLAI